MTALKLYYTGFEGEDCAAEEIAELHVEHCAEAASYDAVDRETTETTPLCPEHKEAAKAAGIAS